MLNHNLTMKNNGSIRLEHAEQDRKYKCCILVCITVCVCEREKERPAADVMAIPAGLSCSFIFLRTNCC